MKIADLYMRVSTDEQADKGYSQRNQEEVLRKYCEINSIQVRKVIFEDHSAKTFNRPEWNKLLADCKKYKGKSDFVLFTKWDRFSRNTGDAYQMINTLRRLGIEPQAVEQPLDLSIPENKMMLAFYLAAPEVENDRRALNVIYGMRRAKKEGRWMATAPVGYINKTDESGRKYIAPQEPAASLIKWVFQELSNGVLAADQIRRAANKKGLKCSRSNFWTVVRNPIYCGKIFIPKFKDDETYLVQGLHEPLISEGLFYDVQDVLDGKRRKERFNTKIASQDSLPLRGFLICPKCGRMLTGSASKGNCYRYYYYHCISPCGCRFKAEQVNNSFVDELKRFKAHPAVVNLYKTILSSTYKKQATQQQSGSKQLVVEINKVNDRLNKARQLLLSEDIDPTDYRTIKAECEDKLVRLESKLAETAATTVTTASVDKLIDKAVSTLSQLDVLYTEATVTRKREIISSIFPEKLCFDGNEYRTFRVNEAARLIYQINNELGEIKNRKSSELSHLSGRVAPTGDLQVIDL